MAYKVGFDIGGTLTKFPEHMLALMQALHNSPLFDVYIITDMSQEQAEKALRANNVFSMVPLPLERLLCADWTAHGDLCKHEIIKAHSLDIVIDDRPDYITESPLIGLCVMPRPRLPYVHPAWKTS